MFAHVTKNALAGYETSRARMDTEAKRKAGIAGLREFLGPDAERLGNIDNLPHNMLTERAADVGAERVKPKQPEKP